MFWPLSNFPKDSSGCPGLCKFQTAAGELMVYFPVMLDQVRQYFGRRMKLELLLRWSWAAVVEQLLKIWLKFLLSEKKISCLLPLFRNFPGLDFLRWARKGVRPLIWPAKAVQCRQLFSQCKSRIFYHGTLSALNLKECGKKYILKIVKDSLGPAALCDKQWNYSYLTVKRSEIIQWTAIIFLKSLILEHKKQTLSFRQYMPTWARTPVNIWTEFACLFNAHLLFSVNFDGHFFCMTTY